MLRDYQMISPSLDGVMSHVSLSYDGLKRPLDLLRVLDGPATKGLAPRSKLGHSKASEADRKVLEQYFHDLYGIFMKKLSHFIVEPELSGDSTLNLQAMLQEMIKVKKLMGRS